MTLHGKNIAITGAGRGIGLATAKALIEAGATVVIGDIDSDSALSAATSLGSGTRGYAVDVSNYSSFSAFYRRAVEDGPLDVLINNAGIMPLGRFIDQPIEAHQRAVSVNTMGCIHGMHVALPDMVARGSGHILNVASTAGKVPVPGGLTYSGTKAAVIALTETARVEYSDSGVKFTCVIPHFTNTELITGTTATKLVPVAQPADVAAGIVAAVKSHAADVFVPSVMRALLYPQPLMGRRLRDFANRRMGAYNAFVDLDPFQRAEYDRRISAAPEQT